MLARRSGDRHRTLNYEFGVCPQISTLYVPMLQSVPCRFLWNGSGSSVRVIPLKPA
jgi:hypothetical protein